MDGHPFTPEQEKAREVAKENYIIQALLDIRQAYIRIQTESPQDIEFDYDIMIEVPLPNQFRVNVNDEAYMRAVLGELFEYSGVLMPYMPGGHDKFGNTWINMQCKAAMPSPGQWYPKTEAILWILAPDMRPQDDPLKYVKIFRDNLGYPSMQWGSHMQWDSIQCLETSQMLQPDWGGMEPAGPSSSQ